MRRRALLQYGALGLGAGVATLFAGWWQVDGPDAPDVSNGRPLPLTAMDFAMTDHERQPVGPQTLIGRASLVFFGFTWCPQVCPTTLADISHWLDGLGTEADTLDVVLITVDPERDTVEAMAEYVGYFHPQIRGWTGSPAEIARAAEGFRVRYEKAPLEGGDYTMNHTSGVFLFDAAGALVSIIDYHEPREFALPKIRRALARSPSEAVSGTG
ncbi:SCO family protein [Pseudosulfitobacter koreensis]|uniref:SCO family protein n=1 Tax=Pseudosulfitobacter koreensis TaxID=2968472 RepID=A0ABT1YWJ9_9RHOB|nr:SCO family protein [Pseudosulfitobacter koreense]MCR8825260.1 SCO family protein [Pseudosulfitobacter koreense]